MNNIKQIRTTRKLTQTTVAKAIGISYQALGLYEKEKCQPDPGTLCKLADYFNVTVDYLIGREDNSGITYPKRFIEVNETEKELIYKFRQSKREAQKFILFLEDEEEKNINHKNK